MRISTTTNIVSADASVDQVGNVIQGETIWRLSAQAVVTGTSTGTLVLQASNDIAPVNSSNGYPAPTSWSPISSTSVSITGSGTYLIPWTDVCYTYIRASFTHTNGAAGTISVNICSQGV